MKKVLALVLVFALAVVCLAGCGKDNNTDGEKKASKLAMLETPLASEQYGIGFKLGNTELKDAVQAALYKLFADGKVNEIAGKYADYNLDKSLCLKSENASTFDVENASAEFKARKNFIVGFDAEYPPYGYMGEKGEYVGFDLDLAEEVCKIYGWTLKKQPIDWNSKDAELSSGSIDAIWNGFTMTGRETAYTWSIPYIDNSQVVVVRSDSGIAVPADLSGKVVAVQVCASRS